MDNNEINKENIDSNMQEYEQIEDKLKNIQGKIENEDLSLDESLDLYEEAVNLGMKASQTIEQNVLANFKEDEDADEEPKIEVVKES